MVGPAEDAPNDGGVSWEVRLDGDTIGNGAATSGKTLSGPGTPNVAIAGGDANGGGAIGNGDAVSLGGFNSAGESNFTLGNVPS